MGIELNTNGYKTIIASLIATSGIPYSKAFYLLLSEIDTYQVEDFIELLVSRTINNQVEE